MSELPGRGEKEIIETAIRVDHAGEYGAVRIYQGQLAILGNSPRMRGTASLIRTMKRGEEEHLRRFDALLKDHKVRPTALQPLWHVAGFALGAATALMGARAAMACTAAVEEAIDAHYGKQTRQLQTIAPELATTVDQFRRDEGEHRETALANGAERAPLYRFLTAAIKAGCRVAIAASERL